MDRIDFEEYRNHLRKQFADYTMNYDPSMTKIRLKIIHTYKVAEICDIIADSLNLSEEDKIIAWTCGMLHDVGRFEQVKRYNTFVDSESVDHANFGADLLFTDNLYEQMVLTNVTPDQKDVIEKAIRAHSSFRIPETLTTRERLFANLLRDADKVDIFRVNFEFPLDEIFNIDMSVLKSSGVSDDVKKAFDEHRCVIRHERKTPVDFLIAHICLVFELVYKKSVEITSERGYIYKLLDFQSDNPDTREWFIHMNEVISDFIDSRD